MAAYNDDIYLKTLNALIGDIYYADGASYDARIARMRKLAEIIIRRLISADTSSPLTLGNKSRQKKMSEYLDEQGMTEQFFRSALSTIKNKGNRSTHSQATRLPTKEDFERVAEAMTKLYAYLFYNYFKRYGFGTNGEITTAFSKLPPYLRFAVLKEFVFSEGFNFVVLDKLSLAAIKALGTDGAISWTERERDRLSEIDIPFDSSDAAQALEAFSALGPEGMLAYAQLLQDMSGSAYDFLMRKIPERRSIEYRAEEYRYDTYEEAKAVYLEHGIIEGDTEDIKEFNRLMRFIYQGRKSEEKREFERCVESLTKDIKDLGTYYGALKDDDEIGDSVVADLKAAKDDIDAILAVLFQEDKSYSH